MRALRLVRAVWKVVFTDEISFPSTGNAIMRLFMGNTYGGHLTLFSLGNGMATGLEISPTRGTLPTVGEYTEVVLYRTQDQAVNFNRFAMAAMPDSFRFDQEAGGTEDFKQVVFAFENRQPLVLLPPNPNDQTGIVIEANFGSGNYQFRQVKYGPPDSAGTGFRVLKIAN